MHIYKSASWPIKWADLVIVNHNLHHTDKLRINAYAIFDRRNIMIMYCCNIQ